MNIIPFINYFTYLETYRYQELHRESKKQDTKLLAITSPVGHGIFYMAAVNNFLLVT